jgi:hypothetical protein
MMQIADHIYEPKEVTLNDQMAVLIGGPCAFAGHPSLRTGRAKGWVCGAPAEAHQFVSQADLDAEFGMAGRPNA